MTEIQIELKKYGIDIFEGEESFKKAWDSLLSGAPHNEICQMINSLCCDKTNNSQYVIFVSEYESGMFEYKYAYRKFIFNCNIDGIVTQKTYYAKRVQRTRIKEVLENENIAKQRYLARMSYRREEEENKIKKFNKQSKKYRKKKKIINKIKAVTHKISVPVRWISFSIIVFFGIVSLVLALLIQFEYSGADEIKIFIADYFSFEDINGENLSSVAMLLFIFACGTIGYFSTCFKIIPSKFRNRSRKKLWRILWLVAYVILLLLVFIFSTKYQINELCDGSFKVWFHSNHTWYWFFSLLFSICSFVWYVVSNTKNIPCVINLIVFFLVIIALPIILIVVTTAVALAILGALGGGGNEKADTSWWSRIGSFSDDSYSSNSNDTYTVNQGGFTRTLEKEDSVYRYSESGGGYHDRYKDDLGNYWLSDDNGNTFYEDK